MAKCTCIDDAYNGSSSKNNLVGNDMNAATKTGSYFHISHNKNDFYSKTAKSKTWSYLGPTVFRGAVFQIPQLTALNSWNSAAHRNRPF